MEANRAPSSGGRAALAVEPGNSSSLVDFFFTQAFPLSLLSDAAPGDSGLPNSFQPSPSQDEKTRGSQRAGPFSHVASPSPASLHRVSPLLEEESAGAPRHRLQAETEEQGSEEGRHSVAREQSPPTAREEASCVEGSTKAVESHPLPHPTCVALLGETAAVGGSNGVILLL
ncbi:hypothetical protein TGMAS_288190A, partial [Toxoplasma gondii MAS]